MLLNSKWWNNPINKWMISLWLGLFYLEFILFGTLWVSWTWMAIAFPILGKFSTIISSSIFSRPFFLTYSSGTPMIQMFGHLTLSQRSLRLSSFPSILFFFPLCLINDDQTQRANIKSSKCKAAKTHEGIPIKITADLSIETLQARRKWQDILKVMKEKNLQPRLL